MLLTVGIGIVLLGLALRLRTTLVVVATVLTDRALPLDELVWRLFHEEEEVRTLPPVALTKGCRCDPDYVRSVIARFPAEERAAMVGEDGFIRVDCAFCATDFPLTLEEVEAPKSS